MNTKLTTLLLVTLGACSTASVRVMPGDDGIHKVSVRDIEKHDAEEEAVDAAEDFCEDREKMAVFLSEKTEYQGDMDEGTRKVVRNASTAASILGTRVSMNSGRDSFGRRKRSDSGSILRGAGMAGHQMTSDKDYQSEITFKCK